MATRVDDTHEGTREEQTRGRLGSVFQWLGKMLLPYMWYVHSPVIMVVRTAPAASLQILATAAKPSTERLHLRNLFANGRRYHIQPRREGFRLTTTSKVWWRYRQRTSVTAVMQGQLIALDDDMTRIQMRMRINVGYLLDVFLIPLFITSFVLYAPWPRPIIAVAVIAIHLASWFGHRFNAKLEAIEMVYFVQKVLEDYVPTDILELAPHNEETVAYNQDFQEEWRKFYEEHRGED